MILDDLATSAAYDALGPRFAAGFEYLRRTNLAAVADGKYPIVGDDVFAIVQTYQSKLRSEGKWEAHRAYADIQYVINGAEAMGFAPLRMMRSQAPYDAERDLEFFDGGPGEFFYVEAGEFAVFFPHDVHMPSLAIPKGQGPFDAGEYEVKTVKKVVVKVRM